jgi:hypothetical protein
MTISGYSAAASKSGEDAPEPRLTPVAAQPAE